MFGKPLLIAPLLVWIALPPLIAQEKSAQTSSAVPTQPAAEKTTPSSQDFSKEAYVIERYNTRLSYEADGTGTRELAAEVKVLADAGVKAFAVLNFTYTSANENVEIDYVRVRKPDGTVVKTPDYNVQDMPGEVTRTAPLYSDIHEKHVAVKGLSVGDVLEYLVRFRIVKAEVPGHFWREYTFAKEQITKDERLEISVPAEKYVKVVSPEFKPEVTQEGNRRIYRWTHQNLIVKEKDPNEPPRRVPPNPDVQITTFASWEDVGRWYGGLQKDPVAVTPAIQAKATELTKGLTTDDARIHAIYNFVSLKFHYIGLDFGIGRYQPHAADDVLDNGYGDCKDKHTLLASLLKAAGIEAWPALIPANRKIDPDVPSPAQFNHVITVIPSGAQYIWLDTTPEVAPFGLILLQLRDKQALVIPGNKPPLLMTTPASPPFDAEQEFSMEGKLDGKGTFTGHAEQSYRGDVEVMLRIVFRQLAETQWKDAVQRFSQGLNFAGEVSNVKVTPPDEIDQPFQISYDYVRKNYGDWENRRTQAPLPPMGLEAYEGIKDKKPLEPVLLGAVGKIIYRGRMELPPSFLAVAPPRTHLNEDYIEYTGDTRIENGVMTTTRELVIKKTEVPLDQWERYRKFGVALAKDEFNQITLERSSALSAEETKEDEKKLDEEDVGTLFQDGTKALQEREFGRAQQLNEKAIARDPNYKGAHFNLGAALLARGRLDEALREFQKEQEVSPGDQRAYQIPAAYLTQMGRISDAEEEWRKLLKADPKNTTAPSALAALLYSQERYTDEVAILEPAHTLAPDNTGFAMQLGFAYMKAGQKEKAVASVRQVIEQTGDDPMMLNNAAWLLADNKVNLDLAQQWAEKAVHKLEERGQGAGPTNGAGLEMTYGLTLVWDTLGWVYFQQGDIKRAETWVRPAWLLGRHEVVGDHLGQIYEKEGRAKDASHLYELSLAAMSSLKMDGFSPADRLKNYETRKAEVTKRYEKLTGRKPSNETRRLPSGQWTLSADEQLRKLHEVSLANEKKLSGTAEFMVTLRPGSVESVSLLNGDDSLDVLSGELKAAHYSLEFPPDSSAMLMVRVEMRCQATIPCVATVQNPTATASRRLFSSN